MIRDLLRGALGFAAVSVAAFSVWAFGPLRGLAMYAAVAGVFVLLTGLVLRPLARGRFAKAFVPAFLAYATVWTAIYFLVRAPGRDWIAAAAGCAAFALVLGAVLGGLRVWPRVFAVVLATHAAGYGLGGVFCYQVFAHDKAGMLSWGLFYGLGFGAGIGYAFHAFQKVSAAPPARP
jgi:hypothetical protein